MRLRSLLRRTTLEAELDEELQFHLDQATADHVARGMTPAAARRAALLSLGGVELRKEECRAARGLRLPRGLGRDISFAVRLLRRQPAFTATVVLTLAIGIGAVASVMTVANWLLLRPLPGIRDPSALVSLRLTAPELRRASTLSLHDRDRFARLTGFDGVTGIQGTPLQVNVSAATHAPQRLGAELVLANYFSVLGVALDGRPFMTDEELLPGAPPVAVVSERAARMLGGDDIIGRTILVNGTAVLVTGIAANGFRGTQRMTPVDIWLPIAQRWISLPPGIEPPARIGRRATVLFMLIGRRSRTHSPAILQEQVSRVEREIAAALPPGSRRLESLGFRIVDTLERNPIDRASLARLFRIVLTGAGLLLLLACANAGNALLARSASRAGELATHLALGASRWRLARALFFEGLGLSLLAGVIGMGLAVLAAGALDGTSILATMPVLERPRVDVFVVAASLAVCLGVAVGASLSAMWSLRHTHVVSVLQRASRSVSPGRRRLTQTLTVAQVALSFTLLVGAALFVRSIDAMLRTDVGFDRAHVQTFRLEPRHAPGGMALAFRGELIDRLGAIPGVRAASVAFLPPFYSGAEARISLRPDGTPDDAPETTLMLNAVHPGFFDAVGVQRIAGRDFTAADLSVEAAEAPLILPEGVARRVFGTTDVVGRFVRTWRDERRQVVGVVRDSRQRRLLADDTMDLAFQPHLADYWTPFITAVMRVDSPDQNIWSDVRRMVADLDPSLVLFEAKSAEEGIVTELGSRILTMRVAVALGSLAVFLAAVGVAAVLARGLAERRREFGIRAALGATPAQVALLVGRQSIVVLTTGLAIGILTTIWLTGYIESRLYGVSRLDPVSLAVATAIVVAAVLAASLPICRRAALVEPATALRDT